VIAGNSGVLARIAGVEYARKCDLGYSLEFVIIPGGMIGERTKPGKRGTQRG